MRQRGTTIIILDLCVWLRRGKVPVIIGTFFAVTRHRSSTPDSPPKGSSELEEEDKTQREEYWTPFGLKPKWRPEPFIRPQIPPTR